MKCQFCRQQFDDMNEIQFHQINSCPAMDQDGVYSNPEPIDVVFKWQGVEIEVGSLLPIMAHLLLSDMDDKIEMNFLSTMEQYVSEQVLILPGCYTGQLILDSKILQIREFEVLQSSEVIYIKTCTDVDNKRDNLNKMSMNVKVDSISFKPQQEVTKPDEDCLFSEENNISSNIYDQSLNGIDVQLETPFLPACSNASGSSTREIPQELVNFEDRRIHIPITEPQTKDFILNKKVSLKKKRKACDKPLYEKLNRKKNNTVLRFSTASI